MGGVKGIFASGRPEPADVSGPAQVGDYVHRFVVVEGDVTFRGAPRELHLPSRPPGGRHADKVRLVTAELPRYVDISRDPCTEGASGEACSGAAEGTLARTWTNGYRSWFKWVP